MALVYDDVTARLPLGALDRRYGGQCSDSEWRDIVETARASVPDEQSQLREDLVYAYRYAPKPPFTWALDELNDIAQTHPRSMSPTESVSAQKFQVWDNLLREVFAAVELRTYIYPEEGALLMGVAALRKARNVVVAGSYFGYWASWVLSDSIETVERVTIVDPDREVLGTAHALMSSISREVEVRSICSTAESIGADLWRACDLLVLDAELEGGSKSVYFDIVRAATTRGFAGTLVAHNWLFGESFGCSTLEHKLVAAKTQLGECRDYVRKHSSWVREVQTTEGLLIAELTAGGISEVIRSDL